MTSRSIVLGAAALLLMSGATPLQIGFSPTAAFAQEITLDAAMAGKPAELNPKQLRERIEVLRDAIQNGTLRGSNRKAAQEKIKAYREALKGMRAERQEAKQERQAEQPRQGERTQRQPDRNAEQRQAEQRKAERQAQREAERQAKRDAQQQRKAEREVERRAQREAQQQRKAEQRQAEQRQAERQAQREAEQRQAERQAERQAQREAEQRQAERQAQREAEQRQEEQQGQRQQRAQRDDESALTREMIAALRDNRPASELDRAELRDRLQALRAAMQSGALPDDQRRSVRARIQADREVALARRAERMEDTTTEQPRQRDRRAERQDRPQQEVDRRAREIIADTRPASDLDNNVLRERLNNNRELLGTDQLSRAERQQLREQLREDRDELRARVAARQEEQEEQEEARAPERNGSDDRTRSSRDRTRGSGDRMRGMDVSRIIEERTPSDQLTERELEERVRVLSRALNRGNITVRQAEVARLLIDRDREELRGRLYADRERRRDRRRRGSRDDVFVEFEVGYRPPPVIYAAEAMPRDIQRQLVAPPMYQAQRAYSPQEIATNHDVRETMPGIEIDTLNFDFGSAEVRPEEIEKLDEIGVVIESIVAERPDEVFLIEGHTDAVGSDAANDALSQQRALAVREALLDYFIIDPENLQTVGLGERYLRINTPDPEEENRRVTVRRITPLLAGRG